MYAASFALVEPGYARSSIAPDLDGSLDRCAAHVDTPHGRLAVRWRRDGDSATIDVEVPVGTTAEVALPAGWTTDATVLAAGRHVIGAVRSR
ncbi:alpha-L-rhamnosidase C-terminal domain-containing protein [Microbacterium rhizosphaerae]|uniref:Alpha-L-rhamnosidase C-terminal domain-containing protein n=1 Tax=Microbacterium rhizosphaerae TaxID=1678237 RepID=A0ABZ0SQC5_9MICO|nr:alpha-L-rhamnosidase C-terminal domain-containing protein [Microbacterium rhizosphaerae]WPR90395.1 alpha-L-rhamnosidase C-terminal domain-containing protein [Microbacterium rhizosphaerae]